jgi:UTP--glucose-1-phosphate uridylyltransferase
MVKKAVIPAAGSGIKFLPVTKAQPKEMLPIIDKPAIQYVVEEAVDSGIEDILIIIGKGKRAIEDHFDRSSELEYHLQQKELHDSYNEIRRIGDMANIHFIRQKANDGLGAAIACAEQHIGNEPFAVLLGDTIIRSVIPVTQQLIDIYEQYKLSIIAVEQVPDERIGRFGIVDGQAVNDTIREITGLVEKPEIKTSPSNLAIAGRYILTPEIFKSLQQTKPDKNGELQLTDALQLLLKRERVFSYHIKGKRYDLGTKLDFIKTNIELSLLRSDFSGEMKKYLKQLVNSDFNHVGTK